MDIEATGLDPYTGRLISIQIASGQNNEVDVIDNRKDDFSHFFKVFLPQYKGKMCIQNANFDLKWLYHNFGLLYFDNLHDTRWAHRIINAGKGYPNNLKYQAKKYLDLDLDKGIRDEFLLPMFQIMDLSETQLQYGALDAWVLPRIAEIQDVELARDGLEKIMWLEMAVLPSFVKAEYTGFLLDVEAWEDIYREEKSKADRLAADLREITGNLYFNPNSEKQLKYEMRKLGIEVPVVHGRETTRHEFIAGLDHPFIKTLVEYRICSKRASTYGEEFLNNINPVTGRVHPEFNQIGADTGRVSSSSPNFQNIPKKEDGKKYRRCFIAEPGFKLIAADFSGQEIMVMAEDSRDPALIAIYQEGLDRHQKTAADLYGIPYEEVTPDQRKIAKTFNFGVSYGSTAWNMANKLGMPIELVERKLADYWNVYQTLQKWQRRAGLIALRDGFSTTFWGRRRYYLDLKNKDSVMRRGANHRIQGCLPPDTKILTREGWTRIGDFDGIAEVWTGEKWATAIKVDRGPALRLRLHLSDGRTFDCDDRHYLLVNDGVWPRWESMSNILGKPLVRDRGSDWGCSDRDVEDWYWAGRMLADGWLSKAGWGMAFGHNEIAEYKRFMCFLKTKNFSGKTWRHKAGYAVFIGGNKNMSVYGSTGIGKEYWVGLGLTLGHKAHSKRIPDMVFRLNKERRLSFLNGYLDGDGYRGRKTSKVTSVNRELLGDVLRLMQTLDMTGNISSPMVNGNGCTWYDLYIHKAEHKLYVESIEAVGYEDMYTLSVDDERHAFSSEGLISKNTSADMTKYATYLIDKEIEERRLPAKFVGFVHDEVILTTPTPYAEDVAHLVVAKMEEAGSEFVKVVKQKAEVTLDDYWR